MSEQEAYNIQSVSFSYGKHRVIDNIGITLQTGRFYGIVGPNGSGKSTLLDMLIRNKHPEKGSISIFNTSLDTLTRRELAKKVALVPQDFYINFDFSVKEIVLMGRHPYINRFSGPSPHDIEVVKQALRETGIEDLKNSYITQLSGGERQRVVFARALAQDTPILLLDEATSNLDIKHTLDLLDIISKRVHSEGRTVISIMHDLNLAAMYCDNLLYLKKGKLAVYGKIEDVLNEKNIRQVFDVDTKISLDTYSHTRHIIYKSK